MLKGADAPLAENDVFIAAGHDVLGAHEPLLIGGGHSPFDHHGPVLVADGLQEVKVLHVSGADLDDVHILEKGQLAEVHQLGDDGQARLLPGDFQVLQSLGAQALEGVGRGAGLEGAAPEHGGAALLHRLGNGHHLFLALHGAGTGHDGQGAAADLGAAHGNDRVLRVEFPVGVFVGLLNPLDVLHDVQGGDEVDVQLGRVAHQSQDGVSLADAGVDDDPLFLEPVDQALQLFAVGVVLQNDNHGGLLLKNSGSEYTKSSAAGPAAEHHVRMVPTKPKITRARFQPNPNKPYHKNR